MSWRDRLWMSLRHIRGRLVESILVIAATAIGVALVASMVAFVRSYDEQTEYLLSHPAYREILVEVIGNETEITEAAVRFDATTSRTTTLGIDDLERARLSVAAVDYAYLADAERFVVGAPWVARARAAVAGGGAAGMAGAGGGFVPGLRGGADSGGDGAEQMRAQLEELLEQEADASEAVDEVPVDEFSGYRVTEEFFESYGLVVATGSLFTSEDLDSANRVMVLGSELARTLFPDREAVGLRVRLGLQTFTVMGVLDPSGLRSIETDTPMDRLAFVPNAAAQIQFAGGAVSFQRPTRTLRFAVRDSAELGSAVDQLTSHFDAEYGVGATRVTASLVALTTEREKLSRILAVVLFLSSAALFIASINMFNLMLMRVIKRTRGIGISRAIGASRREIFRQFINESFCMSLTGAALGLILAPVAYNLLRSSLVADIGAVESVNWAYFVVGTLLALAVSVLFGVYPARQAGRVDASLAIRTE